MRTYYTFIYRRERARLLAAALWRRSAGTKTTIFRGDICSSAPPRLFSRAREHTPVTNDRLPARLLLFPKALTIFPVPRRIPVLAGPWRTAYPRFSSASACKCWYIIMWNEKKKKIIRTSIASTHTFSGCQERNGYQNYIIVVMRFKVVVGRQHKRVY